MWAAAAAGLTLCQAQYTLLRRKEVFNPLFEYRFEITCCNSLLSTVTWAGFILSSAATDNASEQSVALRIALSITFHSSF